MSILKINKLLLKNESTFIALGFGSGLASFAPGTIGTLVAIPLYYFTQLLPQHYDYFFVTTLFFIGIYVSNKTCLMMKVKDPSCIVIDEIVAFLALLIYFKPSLFEMFFIFLLFRIFDIFKPFPIDILEKKFDGGFGIMIDDIAAALYAALIMIIFTKYVF
jgi:phosphatidylglycerophosphatase A